MAKEKSESLRLARFPRTHHLTVGTKTVVLVTENPSRKGLLVYNNTNGAVVYILSSPALGVEDGIPVAYQATYENDDCYGAYWIVSDTDPTDVRVEEDTD